MILVDLDVMIDIERLYAPALEWLDSEPEEIYLPGLVVLELLQGVRNLNEANRLIDLTRRLPVCWPTTADSDRALRAYPRLRLSHGVGLLDALIGECAVGLEATLCTFNVKHFRYIENLRIRQPYAKSTR